MLSYVEKVDACRKKRENADETILELREKMYKNKHEKLLESRTRLSDILNKEYEERKQKNPEYTIDEFATQIGISASILLSGMKCEFPSLRTALLISKELGCSLDYLFGLTNVKKREWDDADKVFQFLSEKGTYIPMVRSHLDLLKYITDGFYKSINKEINNIMEKLNVPAK